MTDSARFIDCAISHDLADIFNHIVALDNVHPQIYPFQARPAELDECMELRRLDVSVAEDWDPLPSGIASNVIVHLMVETGTGQSLTEVSRHANVNVAGVIQVFGALVRHEIRSDKIVPTSSRAIYSRGKWADAAGYPSHPSQYIHAMFEAGQWDFIDLTSSVQSLTEVRASLANAYAVTRFCQKGLVTSRCESFDVTPVLSWLQNVYGSGQFLTSPYAGIISFLARLARQGQSIPVCEGDQIVQDFVSIDDVTSIIITDALRSLATSMPYDIDLGERTTVMQIAQAIAEYYGALALHVTNQFRDGDAYAAWADTARAHQVLNWGPRIGVAEGINRLCGWIDAQQRTTPPAPIGTTAEV